MFVCITDVSSEISSGGHHQLRYSLPSTPKKEIQQAQIQIGIPRTNTLEEMLIEPTSHQDMKQTIQGELTSLEADSMKINTIKNNVPSTSSSISTNYSSFAVKTHEILIHFGQELGNENLPLISSDVAVQLLKIQSSMIFTVMLIILYLF